MKKKLLFACSLLGLSLSSCYMDPYASNVGYSVGYSNFSGGGFGGFSSSVFVSTGDPRWAYDPSLYCYFDLQRRCYYDPFLFGYYPVGYVPVALRGCPHPYGWGGSGLCPAPRSINVRTLSRYDQRLSNYAAAEYHWARRVTASGSPRWLGSSERERLYERAAAPNQPSRVDGWMNGRGLSGSNQSSFRQNTSPSFFSSSRSTPPPAPTFSSRAEQSPSRGGLFGGLERSRQSRLSSSELRQLSQPNTPRVESFTPSRQTTSTPQSSGISGMRGSLSRDRSSSSSSSVERPATRSTSSSSNDRDFSSGSGSRSSFGGGNSGGGSAFGSGRSSSGEGLRGLR